MNICLSESSIFIGSKAKAIFQLQSGNPGYKVVTVDNLDSQIKNYSRFFDTDKLFLVINPSNDEVKIIGQLDNHQYHLFFDDESYDGRNSFISKIKKSNRIFDYSYPVYGDVQLLKRHISIECKRQNIHPDINCYNWIVENCPTLRIKSKAEGSKKEKIVYDIDLLMQELIKLNSIKDTITLEDIEDSFFKVDADIFDFIENLMSGDFETSISKSDKLIDSMGEQGLLMVLLSQLLFMISIAGCKEKNIYNPDLVTIRSEFRDITNKYLADSWNELTTQIKSQNPIRVKIELSKKRPSVENLSKILLLTVETIQDLRSSGNVYQSIFLFIKRVTCITSYDVRR